MILGLDTATKTGWALWNTWDNKLIESGVQDFSKVRGESNGALFLRFRRWLSDMIKNNDVHFIAYEQAHHRGGAATEIGVNLTGRVQEICAEHLIEYATIHTGTLKKFATGKGDSGKEAMMKAAMIILGREPIDDNEADAIFIAKWAVENYG